MLDHIDIKYHFIGEKLQSNVVDVKYIPTEDNVSDIFTKPVLKNKLLRFANIRGRL
jgi:hypothetical protein